MTDNKEQISVDFSDTSIYEDSYAEEHEGTAEFEFIKNSDLYKAVRSRMGRILNVDDALAAAVQSMIPPDLELAEIGFNVIEGEDGEPQNISYSTIEWMENQYEGTVQGILSTGQTPSSYDPYEGIEEYFERR